MHAWYLLNYIAPPIRRRQSLVQAIDLYNARNGTEIVHFLPEIVEPVRDPDGRIRMIERPLLYHYIFLHGALDNIKQLAATHPGLSFVIDRSATHPDHRYLTVSDADMHSFRIIARHYSNRLPYYSPADVELLCGDEVEVVSGDFTGLRGIFISRRGTGNGHIIVQSNQQIGSIAYDIKAEHIRIIRFAKDSRRAYDQIDAFIPRLLDALAAYRADHRLTPAQASALQVFTRRYSITEIPSAKFDAKLQALLWSAHTLLGNTTEALSARQRYERHASAVTNPKTRQLLSSILPL